MTEPRVVATVLNWANTYGTREVLRCLAEQTRQLDAVVVVDNGSPDPFALGLRVLERVDVLRTEENRGVGWGHNAAIRRAIDVHDADMVWVLEHDTFPDKYCLEELLAVRATAPPLSVIATELTRNNYERSMIDVDSDGSMLARVTGSSNLTGHLADRS